MCGKYKSCLKAICFAIFLSCLLLKSACASSWYEEQVKAMEPLRALMKQPLLKRKLPERLVQVSVEAAQGQSYLKQMAAIHALAFADDDASLKVLKQLAQDASKTRNDDYGEQQGAASYALLVRQNLHLGSQHLFETLRQRLRKSGNPTERMFIANRLAVDFADQAAPAIFEAAQVEKKELEKT